MPAGTPQGSHGLPARVQRWTADAVAPGAAVQSACRLAGATSSTLFKVDVTHRGRPEGLVRQAEMAILGGMVEQDETIRRQNLARAYELGRTF